MKFRFNILIMIFLVAVFSLTSCEPDKDENDNNTSYNDTRDKFVGSWNCVENSSQFGQNTYNVTISLNPNNSSEILIANIYHLGFDEKAYAIVNNISVTIPFQYVCNNTNTIKGNGLLSGNNKINWTYYVDDGADIDTCIAVYTRL